MARGRKVILAAVLIAVILYPRAAGAATIWYDPDDYAVFAGNNLELGGHSQIWGRAGAGLDALIYGSAIILGDATPGDLLVNDDVDIRDDAWITGRVIGDNASGGGGTHGILIDDYVTIIGRIDTGGEGVSKANIEVGNYAETGDLYAGESISLLTYAEVRNNIMGAKNVVLGANSHTYGNVNYGGKLTKDGTAVVDGIETKGGVIAPDDYTFTLRNEPTFDEAGTNGDQDIAVDASLDPGVYQDLIVRTGITLSLQHNGTTGTYDFRNITLESGAEITANTSSGDVIIKAYSDLDASAGTNVLRRVGQGQILVQIGDDLTIGANSTIDAHLLAYSYDVYGESSIVTIGNDSGIYGMVYSEDDIIIGERVVIPEPGTLMLLSLGAACMLVRRHRRRDRG